MTRTVSDQLMADGPEFDFFQAVRLLERMHPERKPIGGEALPTAEVIRFRSHLSLAFPPSAIHAVEPPSEDRPQIQLTQTFFGLTGPSGVLPRHYTQTLLDLVRDVRGPERRSLGDWFALFDHRLISFFHRAWEKYRFWIAYERGEAFRRFPDQFTSSAFSLVGLGLPTVRDRLRLQTTDELGDASTKTLAKIDDLALLYYAGMLAQRPRNALNLEAILGDYFSLPVMVRQFHGQWLPIDPPDQTCLGVHGVLGVNALAGSRVWEIQGKFRLRVGPLGRDRFEELLPDRTPSSERKSLWMLSHLTRFYVGPELDFDVQLVLAAGEVPATRVGGDGFGSRLGWNTWLVSRTPPSDVDDAVFESAESISLN